MKWMVVDLRTAKVYGFYANRKEAEDACGCLNDEGGIGVVRPL